MINKNNSSVSAVYKGDGEIIKIYKGESIVYQKNTEQFVDLGLPSGLLWAKGNLIKNGTTGKYSIGKETDWGTYVSWGNIIGHNEGEGYNFDQTTYDGTPGASLSTDIPSNDAAHDIALATLGTPWHLPTKEDFQELYNNTDSEWVADYNGTGVSGRKFMKKSDHSVYVFFPASGHYVGTSLNYRGTSGSYWSSSFYSATRAYSLNFDSSSVSPQDSSIRRRGLTVRPIISVPKVTNAKLLKSYTTNPTSSDYKDENLIYYYNTQTVTGVFDETGETVQKDVLVIEVPWRPGRTASLQANIVVYGENLDNYEIQPVCPPAVEVVSMQRTALEYVEEYMAFQRDEDISQQNGFSDRIVFQSGTLTANAGSGVELYMLYGVYPKNASTQIGNCLMYIMFAAAVTNMPW